jgi:hypothetical protein
MGHSGEKQMRLFCLPPACLLVLAEIISSTLKMEAICSSETSVATQQTTRRHIPEDDTVHISYLFKMNRSRLMRSPCFGVCLCIPHIVAPQRLGKTPPIVARQRLGKSPLIVARQRLGKKKTLSLLSNGSVKIPLSIGNGSVETLPR